MRPQAAAAAADDEALKSHTLNLVHQQKVLQIMCDFFEGVNAQ